MKIELLLAGVILRHLLCGKSFATWSGSKLSLGGKFCYNEKVQNDKKNTHAKTLRL